MRPEIQRLIQRLLPQPTEHTPLSDYYQMLGDYPRRGGKGIRSELLLLSAQAHGASKENETVLWLAAAIELFQNWVLIHDDIEDASEERRGQPALHRLHGVPLAINAGDGLHVYMWEAVYRSGLAAAFGEFLPMVHRTAEGQHLDLSWVERNEWNLNEQDYLRMVELKTAYYTVIYPLRLGALAAGYEPHSHFKAAGLALGAAFQIRDDVLNLIAGDEYGKEIGGDLLEGKRTLILLHWLTHATAMQRDIFFSVMNLPRNKKDPLLIKEIHSWILKSDSINYAQHISEQKAKEGLFLLEQSLECASNKETANLLIEITKKLAFRSY